jgi:RecJ-like exonuclease
MWRWMMLLIVCAGCGLDVIPEDVPNNGTAAAAFAMAAVAETSDKPEPQPSSDKCENCDGKGKVGDGRVMVTCRVCNGTGKKPKSELQPKVTSPDLGVPPGPKPEPKPDVVVPEPIKRVIGMYTRKPCTACDRWMAEEANEWRYRGYEVVELKADPTKAVPYFRVKDEHGDVVFKPGLTWAGYVLYLDRKEKP